MKNRGLWIYLGLVGLLSTAGLTPLLAHLFRVIQYDTIQWFTPITAPPLAAMMIIRFVIHPFTQFATTRFLQTMGLVIIFVLYYAFILSPLGAALITTQGHLREAARRWIWLGVQCFYLLMHAGLAYIGLMLLKA